MKKNRIRNIQENIDNAMGINQLFKSAAMPKSDFADQSDKSETDVIKPFNLKLPKQMHIYIKKMAIDTEKSINELLIEAIKNYYKI